MKTTQKEHERLAYSVREAASLSGIGTSTLRRDISNGRIKVARYGRKVLIPRYIVEELCAKVLKIE